METKSNAKLKALFIIPSVVGVILFMIPVKNAAGEWTVVVKILADIISGVIGGMEMVGFRAGKAGPLPAAAVRADPHRFGSDVPHCAGKAQIHYE